MESEMANENTIDIQYIQMQRSSIEPSDSLYSLSSGSLPSHIRSITPKTDVDITMTTEEQDKTSRCSPRIVYIILVAIFVLSSSAAIAVAVHEIHVIQAVGRLQGYVQMHVAPTTTAPSTTVTASSEKNEADLTTPIYTQWDDDQPTDQRTSCYKKCTMYGNIQFLSSCVAGFCVCRGRYYQKKSCLPSVDGCVVQKQARSKYAFLWNAATTIYSCSVKNNNINAEDRKKIFVVGIYGNHFEKSTTVSITNSTATNESINVVLASHYPIRWEFDPQDTSVSNIVLLSDRELSASHVEVVTQDGAVKPEVSHMYTPVGFGDDRHSFTVEMLQAITKNIGPITKFIGTDYADNILLDVST